MARGRTNHYWFDLNRDYLLLQHPESRGRVKLFHEWKPDIFTDHHEMGTNATFFFQPGVPERKYPRILDINQKLTRRIADYHVKELNAIGSLYYSEEGYDDFYIGKGSTYPDVNGSIGILFEQASSRGHLQESIHGELSFPFTIRNQVRASISTLKAGYALRTDLLQMKVDFFKNKATLKGGYLVDFSGARGLEKRFTDLLSTHQITFKHNNKSLSINNQNFGAGKSIFIPLAQQQSVLLESLFETRKTFNDSLFYDVSAWNLPMAFNLKYKQIDYIPKTTEYKPAQSNVLTQSADYAYLLKWDQYYAPAAAMKLLNKGVRLKAINKKATFNSVMANLGDVIIHVTSQSMSKKQLFNLIDECQKSFGVAFIPIVNGDSAEGFDLGTRSASALKKIKPVLIVGDGVNGYCAGEVWHYFDQHLEYPLPMIDTRGIHKYNLSKYSHLILADGSYSSLTASTQEKIKSFVKNGGNIIAMQGGARWIVNQGWINVKTHKKEPQDSTDVSRKSYNNISKDRGAQVIGGMIAKGIADLTHPITYGYAHNEIALFRKGNLLMKVPKNKYASPIIYDKNPVLSGYLSKENENLLSESAAVITAAHGKGKIILFADNLLFRAYFAGTNKLFANALLFSGSLNAHTLVK